MAQDGRKVGLSSGGAGHCQHNPETLTESLPLVPACLSRQVPCAITPACALVLCPWSPSQVRCGGSCSASGEEEDASTAHAGEAESSGAKYRTDLIPEGQHACCFLQAGSSPGSGSRRRWWLERWLPACSSAGSPSPTSSWDDGPADRRVHA